MSELKNFGGGLAAAEAVAEEEELEPVFPGSPGLLPGLPCGAVLHYNGTRL